MHDSKLQITTALRAVLSLRLLFRAAITQFRVGLAPLSFVHQAAELRCTVIGSDSWDRMWRSIRIYFDTICERKFQFMFPSITAAAELDPQDTSTFPSSLYIEIDVCIRNYHGQQKRKKFELRAACQFDFLAFFLKWLVISITLLSSSDLFRRKCWRRERVIRNEKTTFSWVWRYQSVVRAHQDFKMGMLNDNCRISFFSGRYFAHQLRSKR